MEMDDSGPGLGVGFEIDTGDSFGSIIKLDDLIGETAANAVREFKKIEQASKGSVDLGLANASVKTFGAAATREAQTAARELTKVEKAGEALVRQLERQASSYGKTREEMRGMKAEAQALAAEQQGLTELAGRLRAAEQSLYDQEFAAARRARIEAEALAEQKQQAAIAAEIEAKAIRDAAAAHAIFEAKVRQGLVAMREKDALDKAAARDAADTRMRAEAAAAAALAAEHERLVAAVRGSHAAQMADVASLERLRESTDPLYAATKRLNAEIAESTRLYHAGVTAPAEYARQQEVLADKLVRAGQAHDQVEQANKRVGHSLTQLSFQVNDIATMWGSGASAGQIFATQAGQIVQVVQTAEGGFMGLARAVGAALLPFAPLIAAVAVAGAGMALFVRSISDGVDTKAMVNGLGLTQKEIKRLKDTSVGAGDVIKATFQVLAERVGISLGGLSTFFTKALDWMTVKGRQALALIYAQFVGTFRAIGTIVDGVFSGKSIGTILADVGNTYKTTFKEADTALVKLGEDITKRVGTNKLTDLRKQADAIKAERTPKADRHAESLQREAEATEAQIKNLYALAAAYRTSDAAALVAEARVKAESQAIKQRADIEAAIDRQVRLAIAQRVSDGEKSAATTRAQAIAQEQVNALVAAGLVPAERAAELVRERIADLPLLAAIEAAQQRGLTEEVAAATQALNDQRAARERATTASRDAQFLAATGAANDEIERLQLEARMINATAEARVRALATLKAWQEAQRQGYPVDQALAYVAAQVRVAVETNKLAVAQDRFNSRFDLAIDLAHSLGDSLSDAFGRGGDALGNMLVIATEYQKRQAEIDLSTATESVKRKQSSDLQLKSMIGLTSAARGLFSEHSKGYKAMMAAEQALTVVQLARTAVDVAGGAARMFAQLGPFAFPAVAAMLGVMASLGFASGGSAQAPATNQGTGTVFGDSSAKSDSLKRSIEFLGDLEGQNLVFTRQMAASLKNIESNIGGLTNLVIRLGGTDGIGANAEAGVKTGFSSSTGGLINGTTIGAGLGVAGALSLTSGLSMVGLAAGPIGVLIAGAIGAALSKVPVIGDILGGIGSIVSSLFGTKTKIVGSGIFGGAQTLGDIESLGFAGQTFADIQKKKKFLGVTTSTKYSTQYGDLDDSLEDQFGKLLLSFADAIKLAAGPLGLSLGDVEAKLATFVVDIGKIDLKDLSGEEIQEKLTAVFGAQADKMAQFVIAGLDKYQEVGEGYFETLVRVATTVDTVTASLQQLGLSAQSLGIDASMAISDLFGGVDAYASAADAYFSAFYTDAEQAAAKTAQLGRVFDSLGITMPDSIASYRALVEAQDLTTAAGQQLYAQLLSLAPAFAEVVSAGQDASTAAAIVRERNDLERQLLELEGKTAEIRQLELAALDPSNRALQERIYALQDEQTAAQAAAQAASDLAAKQEAIANERKGLERQLLELTGNTAAIRALDLAALDASNRALQAQIWALQDQQTAAQEAAQKATELADAWRSAGDTILDEINRIRGLDSASGASLATLQAQFDAANKAARGGDIDAANSLPELSKSLLEAAAAQAQTKEEYDAIKGLTAGSLEQTYAATQKMVSAQERAAQVAQQSLQVAVDQQAWWQSFSAQQAVAAANVDAANDALGEKLDAIEERLAGMADDQRVGHAAIAAGTSGTYRILDNVTQGSGGDAFTVQVDGTVDVDVQEAA